MVDQCARDDLTRNERNGIKSKSNQRDDVNHGTDIKHSEKAIEEHEEISFFRFALCNEVMDQRFSVNMRRTAQCQGEE